MWAKIASTFGTAGVIGGMVIIIGLLCGWVMNIIAIVTHVTADNMEVTAMFIARCVGVVFGPLGGILGWL